MDTPLISVILPTYNGARYIRNAIDSALSQDYENFELIIINDASTDDTTGIVEEYSKQDWRIIPLRNEKNLKLVSTLNRGIKHANGEFIARIDDDDIWHDTEKLSKQMRAFQENPKLWIVGTLWIIIDEDWKETGWRITHAINSSSVRKGFWIKNQLIHTSILAKKEVFKKAWLYSLEWLYVEDFDLWLRVLSLGYEIMNIPDYSVKYRVREWNTTSKKYHRMQWLTFLRLFRDKNIYTNMPQRLFSLSIRIMLAITPLWIIRFLDRIR